MKITERGWKAHYINADKCRFSRNTFIEHKGRGIVVSTVGAQIDNQPIGINNRHYETYAFNARWEDPYWEANIEDGTIVERGLHELNRESDLKADEMHEEVVWKMVARLLS